MKVVDKKAPRVRIESERIIGPKGDTARFYTEFKKKYPQYKKISNKELGEIIFDYNGRLWQEVINNRNGVSLPEQLGVVQILMHRPKKNYINYEVNNKAKKVVRYLNLLTDGLTGKINYSAQIYAARLRSWEIWKFKATRSFTHAVSECLPKNYLQYRVVDNYKVIWENFDKNRKRNYAKKMNADSVPGKEFEGLIDLGN